MTTFHFSPLWRSTVGFDRVFDLLEDSAQWAGDNYPPYNIERSDVDHYQISLALAGFSPDEVTVTAEQNILTIEGRKADKGTQQFLYQGISPVPPAVQPGRICASEGRFFRGRHAQDRTGARNSRSDEAAPDSDPSRQRQSEDRAQADRLSLELGRGRSRRATCAAHGKRRPHSAETRFVSPPGKTPPGSDRDLAR